MNSLDGTGIKIATHDSVTGEEGWWLTKPLTIFARTQSKTIKEQYQAGCRYFDIRVRKTKRGWICAHGLWESLKTVDQILQEISDYGGGYCNITYEGFNNSYFLEQIFIWRDKYPKVKLVDINIKYYKRFKWKNLLQLNQVPGGAKDQFFKLDFRSWHTLIPIPILWKKIYGPNPEFNSDYFQFVDFL